MINRLIFNSFNTILYKAFACVLFCFLYLVFLSSTLYANEIEDSNTSDNSQKLVIASSNNFPPINTLDDNGQLTGFGRDLSTAVAKSLGIKVQHIHSGNWSNVLKWLDEGTADLIHDTGFTPERESYLDFTVPILEMPESIFVLNWQYDIQDISSLKGKKVACVNHHITHLYLQQFKEIQCYLVSTPVEGLLALINGKVDAFIYPEQIILYLSQQLKLSDKLKVVGKPLRVLSWSMTVKKGNKELLEKLNRGIKAVKESGKYKKIYNKWFGKHLFSGYSTKSVFAITTSAVLLAIFLVVTIGLLFYVRGIKKANQALADSENKYKTLIDKLPMNVFLKDTNSVYLSCNQRYADSLGIKSEDIVGKNDFDFHPDNAQIYQSGDKVIMVSGETHDFVESFIDNGREIFIQTIKTPVYNDAGELTGVLGIFWDITAEKEAQQEIILKEKEQREMLNSMVSAVLTIDDTGKILTFNKAAEKLFGYAADEIIGQTVNHLMPDSSAGRHDGYLKHYDEKRELSFIKLNREVIGQTKNKETFPVFVSVAELPHQEGEHRHFIASCQDLSEIKQQQEQIRQTQKMDALGKLTGGIAHDFNNLLGIILGYAELLDSKLKDQTKLKKYAHEIQSAGKRGSKLTKKLLNFSSTEMSEANRININELLLAEQDMLSKSLTVRVKLVFDLDEDLWPVWLNGGDLENAILNMCINAMHAIEGNGQITIQTQNIKLDEADVQQLDLPPGDYVSLSIIDTGSGMDDVTREKIFEPFYSTKGEKGTGLGLSQVYGFIERSTGGIKVNSMLDHGTEFILYFPRYTGDDDQNKTTKENILTDVSGKETILVVDDEKILVDLLSEVLGQKGYAVLCAERAEQALKIMEKEPVDLIISDVVMPEMDGYQFVSIVQEKYPDIKIQMVSGFTDESHLGIKDKSLHENLLHKPYQIEELLKRVRSLLDK